MKIGIDAKWYFSGPPSGRRVVRGLVEGLMAIAGREHELHLFLDERAAGRTPPGFAPERCHYIWGHVNQLANLSIVPGIADRVGLDAVVYQNFAPPMRRVRHARIAFVHDVIFAERPEFFTWRERLYFAPLRALTVRASRVCTVSESEKLRMARLGYAISDRIDVVPNAVDDVFHPRAELDPVHVEVVLHALGIREPYVLFVGRLTARKNVAALVRAMAHVKTANLLLVIVGAVDPTSADLPEVARTAGVGDRVRFVGPMGDDRLPALYAAASVFCFASLDESFGLPPLEAMAAGTPAIVSDRPAIVETCGDAAVYIDPTDPVAIAGAIDALMNDAPRRAALIARGRVRASAFTWKRSAERLFASVQTAVEARA
jgi:glycosyltransferase involved in cell wall biosynthesis